MINFSRNKSTATVCSREYAAWHNTTVFNYAFTRPDVLTRHRTTISAYTSEACFPGYPFSQTGLFGLLSAAAMEADANPIYRYDNNYHEIVGTEKEKGIAGCDEFPLLPVSRAEAMGDEYVARIRRDGTKTPAPNTRVLKVCSKTYSAWYNTTLLNYVLLYPNALSRSRNPSEELIPETRPPQYPFENVNIYQLWDGSNKAAPGMPE